MRVAAVLLGIEQREVVEAAVLLEAPGGSSPEAEEGDTVRDTLQEEDTRTGCCTAASLSRTPGTGPGQ